MIPARLVIIVWCVLIASAGLAVRYALKHDEAWWWAKALLALSISVALGVPSFLYARALARSSTARKYRNQADRE